jgi:hypothetical protein
MSSKNTAAIVAATIGTAIGAGGAAASVPVENLTKEKAETIAALRQFDTNRSDALASLAEKLRASGEALLIGDVALLEELRAASEKAVQESKDKALTPAQMAYLKPVQVHAS